MSSLIETTTTGERVRSELVHGCSACGRTHVILFVRSYSSPTWPWVGACDVKGTKVYMRDRPEDAAAGGAS